MAPDRLWILLGKKKNGEASAAELKELESLIEIHGEDGFAHEIVDKVWEAGMKPVSEIQASRDSWSRISEWLNKKSAKNKTEAFNLSWKRWAVAASVIVLFGSGWLVYTSVNREKAVTPTTTTSASNNISTQSGSKSKIELPDGTQVWLNANSRLSYGNTDFKSRAREVTLSGEAFFDVVKNEKNPFIIHTQTITITVKGTAFNVKAYANEKTVETSLVRGLIEITTKKDPDRKILLKPNEKIIIPVDDVKKAEVNQTAPVYFITPLKIASGKTLPDTVWMQNSLRFDNETMDELAPKLEHWFNIRIQFYDDEIKTKRFSGVIEKESLKQMLDAMQLSYHHLRYEIKDNELWIGVK